MTNKIKKTDNFYQESLIWMGYRYAIGLTDKNSKSGRKILEQFKVYRDIEYDTPAFHELAAEIANYLKRKKQEGWSDERLVVLRHDVDARPVNSLKTAQVEHSLGIKATYYFRAPKGSSNGEGDIIRAIVRLGHEIGYHYEDLSLCYGDIAQAYAHFETYLRYFRQYYAVETICAHGSPRSKYDNRDLWKVYDYQSLGIIGEPYLDTDFSDVFYLTDTGRCWDGYKVSVRDKIPQYQDEWTARGLVWHTTNELISAIEKDQLPAHVMITTHPQRWTNNKGEWWKECVLQNAKNIVKRLLIIMK